MSMSCFGFWVFLAGMVVLTGNVSCLRGSALVAELKAKAKAALLNPSTEVVTVEQVLDADGLNTTDANTTDTVNKPRSLLTGIPQKDYIYDPNLPRELNGYNLSSYPFYNSIPEDIDFKCDNLHDGFYASVPHKCQVYHHCLFGTRYDFLCANYTAFDQKTFICHFVSEVDCDNSPKYFQRNEALYKEAATTTTAPLTLRQTTPPPTTTAQPPPHRPRRRRPYRRRRPVYEYYYDDQYDDEEYYEDDPPPPRRKTNRKQRPQGGYRGEDMDYYDVRRDSSRSETSRNEGRGSSSDNSQDTKPTLRVSGPAAGTVYDQPRVPPKIRRPVPIHERDKYDYTSKSSEGVSPPTQIPKKSKPQVHEDEDEYYEDEYEDDYAKPPPKRANQGNDYSTESKGDSRRSNNRQRQRPFSRRRPERYDDEYDDDRPLRPRKRPLHEEQLGRGNRGGYRGYSRDEPDPVPADRPGFISNGRFGSGNKKRAEESRSQTTTKRPISRVVYDDEEDEEEYYDDEEDETQYEDSSRRHYKHSNSRHSNYEPEERKQNGPSRKQSELKQNSRPDDSYNSDRSQGGSPRNEPKKTLNKQKFDDTTSYRDKKDEQCQNNCRDDYLYDSNEGVKQENTNGNSSESNNKDKNEQDNQKQKSERDKLFSSRFRDSQSESKTKEQSYEPSARSTSAPLAFRMSTQNPELRQRYNKPSIRLKPSSDEVATTPKYTPTSTASFSAEESSEESSTTKHLNFRSKGRLPPIPTPSTNNFKLMSPTDSSYENSQSPESNVESEQKTGSNEYAPSTADKHLVSPRPFSSVTRRPNTQSGGSAPVEELINTKQYGYQNRPSSLDDESDERYSRKPGILGQNPRRVKPDSSTTNTENTDYTQPKFSTLSNNFRRPIKQDDPTPEAVKDIQEDSEDLKSGGKIPLIDKSQLSNSNYSGFYKRVKISPTNAPATELEVAYESPVNNNKRPHSRPLNKNPVEVDGTPKNIQLLNIPLRRPIKQRVQDAEVNLAPDEYNNSPVVPEGLGESYRKPESNLGVNLRPNFGYNPLKRGKIRTEENSASGLDQYSIPLNQEDQFSKQVPKIEITAPGPSAPGVDSATVKYNYNGGPAGFPLDIPEEEYDVTLNDALQPSTLHPTSSLVDYHQTRLKSRDYQPNIGRSPEYGNRGRISYMLSAASQQVPSVVSGREEKRDPEEYEAVVLTAPGDQWSSQPRNRPTEWFW